MKKFKILLLAISFLLFVIFAQELIFGSYGEFGDGTGSKDSVWMNVSTFDTLGFEANADSVWFIRYFRTTLVDTTKLGGAGNAGTAHYTAGKRAFDGDTTHYGEYTVKKRWKVQGKYLNKEDCYTVVDYVDSTDVKQWVLNMMVENSFAQTGTDKVWRLRGLAIRGTTGSDTGFIAMGYGYGMGMLAKGGLTGADGLYALGGATGAGFHAVGGSGDGAEGIFAEGTGSGPGTYSLGGSSGAGLQVIGQGAGAGIRADGGSSGNGITATGFGAGSGLRAIKGSTGYDFYGNLHSRLDSLIRNEDKTNYGLTTNYLTKADSGSTGASYLRTKYLEDKTGIALTSAYLTKADSGSTGPSYLRAKYLEDKTGIALTSAYLTKSDSGSTGASYLRAKYVEDKIEYRLSSQGRLDIVTYDTTGLTTGWVDVLKDLSKTLFGDKQTFYRPGSTSAPDSVRSFIGTTLIQRQIYYYNGSGKLDSTRTYIY